MKSSIFHKAGMIMLYFLIGWTCISAAMSDNQMLHNHEERIISLSGLLTEVLYEVGYGNHLVAVDVTSTYPSEANNLPKLGHVSQLNVEAIMKLKPDIIFIEKKDIHRTPVIERLKGSGIKIAEIETRTTFNNTAKTIRQFRKYLPISTDLVTQLSENMEEDSLQLSKVVSRIESPPKVLFIYARGTGNLMVAGKSTNMAAMIEKSGGKNAIQSFENFRALTPEALVKASPDFIVMFESGFKGLSGRDGLKGVPGIDLTPAYRNDKILTFEGNYISSFGPRSLKAANELAEHFVNGSNP